MKKIVFAIVLVVIFILLIGEKESKQNKSPSNSETFDQLEVSDQVRNFNMGFSGWPPEFTVAGIEKALSLANDHSDIRLLHFDGGVPWVEMSNHEDIPPRIYGNWDFLKERINADKLLIALTPLNFGRDGIALYANDKDDNQDLPAGWGDLPLNDNKVKEAYLRYAQATIAYWQPDYLAIGIEPNIALNKNKTVWDEYFDLHVYIYEALKKEYPDLPIFASIQMEHFKAITSDSTGNEELQLTEVKRLMQWSDVFAMSLYPYTEEEYDSVASYLAIASSFNKPMAISETGWPSEPTRVFGFKIDGSEEAQAKYLSDLLAHANQQNYLFVINWTNVDYDNLLTKLPFLVREFAKLWVHTGLWDKDFNAKPALSVWDQYFNLSSQ